VDEQTWREVRAEAIRRGMTTGALLSAILREWLECRGQAPAPDATEGRDG
jgi:hypothetical protein